MLHKTIGQILPETAEKYSHKTALICGDQSFSFSELDRLSNRVASSLAEIGITSGDRVTLYAQNGWEWIVAYYGIAKTGAVLNPINVMLTPNEVAYVVKDCGAKALFTTSDRATPILKLKEDINLQEIITFGDSTPDGALAFDELIASGNDLFDLVPVDASELGKICYTSGTTGFPKGAMLSHRNVVLNAAMTAAMNMRVADDVQLTALPCAHVYGAAIMNLCFLFGSTFVVMERFEATEMLDAIQIHKATVMDGVPTMYLYMLAHPDFDSYDLSSLTRSVVGGQTMPSAKSLEWEERAGNPLLELWGMTELAGPGVMQHSYGENRLGSVGVEMLYVRARIADAEDASKTMPNGEVGELMIAGPLVMLGYFGNEDATREAIEPDGWLHSGDLAKMDDDGYIFVVDRKKDMILTAGYNIYPAEIERVISSHAMVAMVGVGAKEDPEKGEVAKAYVVLKQNGTATTEDIKKYCRDHLAAYKVPREVQIVSDLPTTSTGKILRRELHTLDGEAATGVD
ncbi:MAG: acyl-CoA synthase [Pelagibacteraceae bacterium]|nr:acyl-CoA synthase [Pelagibacteraceae bacterium]PPR10005.1 MAG: Long-chain-fatty-acid--CoA ligase [Alphaproteobacteria bacterium MarineAlpha11_Bin1]|tara:strand:+ start:5163 stop:6707 length:1545 start_codon:yes stop_codon:yes gene_type:complete